MTRTEDFRERRRDGRVSVELKVRYTEHKYFVLDYAANLSLGGMFIRTSRRYPVGTRLEMEFEVPGRLIRTMGTVRYLPDMADVAPAGQALEPGMGIQFDPLDPDDEEAVKAWLENW